jgi:hypothetical protein
LAKLRLRNLGQHFMKPHDSEDTFICRILHSVQDAGLLNAWAQELHKRSILVKVHGSLRCLPFCSLLYSTYPALTGLSNRDRPCRLKGINKSFINTVDKCQLSKGYLRAQTTLPYQVQTSIYHPYKYENDFGRQIHLNIQDTSPW